MPHNSFTQNCAAVTNIIPYHPSHKAAFKELNLEWLDKYHLTEGPDLLVLNDPESTILANGGVILLAENNGEIVGSVALIHEGHNTYELAKMAVTEKMQGKGISRLLIDAILQKAENLQAKKLILYSNSQLQTAIALYFKYGFRHVAVTNSPFETADVMMEKMM